MRWFPSDASVDARRLTCRCVLRLTNVLDLFTLLMPYSVGLTAYDTQKIKNMYFESDSSEVSSKKAVMGALTLYLDFINLFIMLLRLFGQRR